MTTSKVWYEKASCKIHLDMHCPEWHESILENFDAKRIVEQVAAAGADALYFFAKDHYGNAYYQTRIGHRHRCLGDRDFLAEIIAEARHVELPIMAYFSVIWDNHAAQAHPEWCMRNPNGQALSDTITSDHGKWQYVCHNSGYAEQLSQMIDEVASQHSVAGFHLDMLNYDFGGQSCYCDNCRRMFRERTGHDLPEEATWDAVWREFLEFRYDSVERLFERLKQTALRHDPASCVVMNYHASPDFDWRVGQQPVRHSLPGTLGTGETYTPAFGDLYPGMESRFIRNIAPGKPFELVAWRMNRITDFTVKPREQLRWEILSCLQHRGSVMLIDQPMHDGTLDPVAYDRVREVFQEAHQLEPHFHGEFVTYVGLYYSARSRDLYARGEQEKFLLPIMGSYKALVESHVPVDFVFDEMLTKERLAQFPVIVLPNVAALSEFEVQLLTDYVREGGNLIATLDTSLYSEFGDRLEDFRLAEVFGVSYGESVDCDNNYFSNLTEPYTTGIDRRYKVLNQGCFHRVERRTASGVGDLHDAFFKRRFPDQFFSHNIHPPHQRLSDALYINRFGRGTCIYVPFGLDRSYADYYELPEHRRLLANLVKSLSPPPLVEIEAPLNCEAVLTQEGTTLRIHLTMFNPLRQSTTLPSLDQPIRPSIRMEEAALYQATVRCEKPFQSVSAVRDTTDVQVDRQQIIEVTCRDVYEVLTIEL